MKNNLENRKVVYEIMEYAKQHLSKDTSELYFAAKYCLSEANRIISSSSWKRNVDIEKAGVWALKSLYHSVGIFDIKYEILKAKFNSVSYQKVYL